MFRHLGTKMLVLILPVVLLTVILSTVISSNTGRNIIDSQIQARIEAEQNAQLETIGSKFKSAENLAEDLSVFVHETYRSTRIDSYEQIMSEVIKKDDIILGAGIWFEPYLYDGSQKYMGPYVYKSGTEILRTYAYSNEEYDYFTQYYYTASKNERQTVLTNPYYDLTSDLYMITCAVPLIEDNKYIGCVTVDIQLSELQKLVTSFEDDGKSDAYILGRDGTYLAATDKELVESGRRITEEGSESMQKATGIIMKEDSGMTTFTQDGRKYRAYYSTIPDVQWKIVSIVPVHEILAPIYEYEIIMILIGIIAAAVVTLNIMGIINKSIDRPVSLLSKEFKAISEKNYSNVFPDSIISRKDEFGVLGRSVSEMKGQIERSQKEIENALAESIEARKEANRQNELLKQSEDNLLESVRYIQSIIQLIPDIIFILSKDGIFLDCQGSTESLLYIPKEEFIGKSITEVMPEEIGIEGMKKVREAFELGTVQYFEYEIPLGEVKDYFEMRLIRFNPDRVMGIARRMTEQHMNLMKIQYLSYNDQVTGLHNRRYFDEELIKVDVSENLPLSMIIADVNGLKMVNDSFGHNEGDKLLIKFAYILKEVCAGNERVARIGGDEFAVIMCNSNINAADKLIKQITMRCEQESINAISLSVSLGAATKEIPEESLGNVIRAAEDMMYKKKLFEAPGRRGKTMEMIISTLHEKNPREEQHSYRVAKLCEDIASVLDMNTADKNKIRSAGLLHDIGKIGIPEEYLNKTEPLTNEEYEVICRHPEIGFRILRSGHDMGEIAEITLSHHERWDGKGYPRGISGEEIPLFSRIIAIADAFDAMTSNKSYKPQITESEAVKELMNNAGTQFDPYLVERFVRDVLGIKNQK